MKMIMLILISFACVVYSADVNNDNRVDLIDFSEYSKNYDPNISDNRLFFSDWLYDCKDNTDYIETFLLSYNDSVFCDSGKPVNDAITLTFSNFDAHYDSFYFDVFIDTGSYIIYSDDYYIEIFCDDYIFSYCDFQFVTDDSCNSSTLKSLLFKFNLCTYSDNVIYTGVCSFFSFDYIFAVGNNSIVNSAFNSANLLGPSFTSVIVK